jgi:uncharacterized protein YbaP (TraB family)
MSIRPKILGLGCLLAVLLAAAPALAENPSRVLMWRVTGPAATVYVLGTLHLGKPDLYPLDRAITRALDRSRVVALEADVSPDNLMKIAPEIMSLVVYPAGQDLKTGLSADTWKMLQNYASRTGFSLQPFRQLRPWLLSTLLAVRAMKKLGYSERYGVDGVLRGRARAAGKKMVYLETVLEQIKLLADMTPDQQDAFLAHTLREMAKLKGTMAFMVRAWQKGDAKALERYLFRLRRLMNDPRVGPVYRRIVFQRNKKMAAAALKYLAGKRTVLIAVGAMHLVGPRGVINLLHKRGFKVVQVRALGRPHR